ncbi:hypothetical protein [Shewanella algae]|uniref:hypothetical protein n=1 Tax=Shewanella algae TaxID=38313 RepID=UPI0011845BD8|nr:hypothetical protein [Shewanella algae]TVO82164.1 hypothetical protein AYI76_15295 [Shewanella algae]TVO83302.1 hypothetical protein AYI78_13550 [Shewanella algae]TVO87695.1 hypothetical protein AYI80_14535 [Shewanella algae]TVO94620.1 hypothetical protein AYI79_13060 [Shewanella algae]TXS85024.1 hypothetical protein AYI81_17105 [Shewanella algae]
MILITLLAVFILISLLVLDTYVSLYFVLLVVGALFCFKVDKLLKPIVLFVVFYLLVALLNISTWRGYTEVFTLKCYILSLSLLVLPMLFGKDSIIDKKFRLGKNLKFVRVGLSLHLFIAYSFVAYIYITKGIVLVNQDARFGIPTGIEYSVKSVLPIAAFIPFLFKRYHVPIILLVVLPSILLGYRGTSVLAVVSYVISVWYVSSIKKNEIKIGGERNKKPIYIFFGIICFFIVFSGFYLRRTGSSELATVDVLLDIYFDYNDWWVYLIIPFYLGFKETIGLTNSIISSEITNNINEHTLFFADLFTVLPGERLAAGQSLGKIFGTIEDGGLTPGLLGGLYIDYGFLSFVFFFISGLLIKITVKLAYRHVLFIPVASLIITQFIHLFHRGFLKPEYITSVAIALFYYLMINKVKI